jgi:hypothetical protein
LFCRESVCASANSEPSTIEIGISTFFIEGSPGMADVADSRATKHVGMTRTRAEECQLAGWDRFDLAKPGGELKKETTS